MLNVSKCLTATEKETKALLCCGLGPYKLVQMFLRCLSLILNERNEIISILVELVSQGKKSQDLQADLSMKSMHIICFCLNFITSCPSWTSIADTLSDSLPRYFTLVVSRICHHSALYVMLYNKYNKFHLLKFNLYNCGLIQRTFFSFVSNFHIVF